MRQVRLLLQFSEAKMTEDIKFTLELCLDYVLRDADAYGTASTAGPLLNIILRTLGRTETADELVAKRREERRR